MRTLQRVGAGLLTLTLIGGLAACGDDDSATSTTGAAGSDETTTTLGGGALTADNDAFCGALVDFNSAATAVELDESSSSEDIMAAGDQLAPLSQALADRAPDDVADAAAEINDAVQPLTAGDAEAFNADSTYQTYLGFVGDAVGSCGFETVSVTGVDYAFEGAPDSIDAGTVAFDFTNGADDEDHEMVILKKTAGVDLSWDDILALPDDEAMSKVEFKGVAFAPVGQSGSSLVDLEPGEYVMACFLPLGGAEDGAPHFTQGMLHEFTVQ